MDREWGKDKARNRIMIQMINYIYTVNKYQQSTQVQNQPPAPRTEKWLGDFLHHGTHQEGAWWHVCNTRGSGRWLHDQCSGQQGQCGLGTAWAGRRASVLLGRDLGCYRRISGPRQTCCSVGWPRPCTVLREAPSWAGASIPPQAGGVQPPAFLNGTGATVQPQA
jgi:hypothetical protein